jgi:hypothetical protein
MKLLADTFQRTIVLGDFKKWFLNNIRFFLPGPLQTVQEPLSIAAVDDVNIAF